MGTRLCVSLAFPHLRNYGSVDHVELIPPGQLFELLVMLWWQPVACYPYQRGCNRALTISPTLLKISMYDYLLQSFRFNTLSYSNRGIDTRDIPHSMTDSPEKNTRNQPRRKYRPYFRCWRSTSFENGDLWLFTKIPSAWCICEYNPSMTASHYDDTRTTGVTGACWHMNTTQKLTCKSDRTD